MTVRLNKAMANLESWRRGQGAKIRANRVHEIYRACDHQAQLLSALRSPLILSANEIREAMKCAISQRRARQHGPLSGISADAWWAQISAIGAEWNVPMIRAEWESATKHGQADQNSTVGEPRGEARKSNPQESAEAA